MIDVLLDNRSTRKEVIVDEGLITFEDLQAHLKLDKLVVRNASVASSQSAVSAYTKNGQPRKQKQKCVKCRDTKCE